MADETSEELPDLEIEHTDRPGESQKLRLGAEGRFRPQTTAGESEGEQQSRLTMGQWLADRVAAIVGSWTFIIVQSLLLVAWIILNVWLAWNYADPTKSKAWDPYPFILLNLMLSFQAAYTGPVVMMSQNRQAEKDRLTAQHDFEIDTRAEGEIRVIMEHLAHQDKLLLSAINRLEQWRGEGQQQVLERVEELFKKLEETDRRALGLLETVERLHPGIQVTDHSDFPPHDHK